MSTARPIEATADLLRKAVAEGSFARTEGIVLGYRSELDQILRDLPRGGAEARQIVREAKDLLEWARRMLLISRSHLAAELRALPSLTPYDGRQASRRQTWELLA